VGFWNVGVPPSGPMDSRSFRLANALVANNTLAAGLEISLSGTLLPFPNPFLSHPCQLYHLLSPPFYLSFDTYYAPFINTSLTHPW